MLLIDKYLPKWDVRERHSILVPAPREATYAAIIFVSASDLLYEEKAGLGGQERSSG